MSAETLPVAVVTGASAGIGAVYADRLAKRGHGLILAARDKGRLEANAAQLRDAYGVAVEVFAADLTDKGDLGRLAQRLETDPAIGLMVNNAGSALFGSFAASDPEQVDNLIQLNVGAVTRLAQAAVRGFKARGGGVLVNVGSVVGLLPEYRTPVYGATKAYVLYLTQALDIDLAGKGIQFQAVLPGATRTEIWDRSGKGQDHLDPDHTMEAGELVDAALAGLDRGELVTIPSLPDPADWEAFQAARLKMAPNFSHAHPAPRYGVAPAG